MSNDFFSELAGPFTSEAVFDLLPDLVFFVKNRRCEYVAVNQTLVKCCGRQKRADLIGRRADELIPPPLGGLYRAQDENVMRDGAASSTNWNFISTPTADAAGA